MGGTLAETYRFHKKPMAGSGTLRLKAQGGREKVQVLNSLRTEKKKAASKENTNKTLGDHVIQKRGDYIPACCQKGPSLLESALPH